MSSRSGGYSNGYSDAGHDSGSRGRPRRAGGYGGFQFEETQLLPSPVSQSPARMRDQEYRDRQQQQSQSRSRTREAEPRAARNNNPVEHYAMRNAAHGTDRYTREASPMEGYKACRSRNHMPIEGYSAGQSRDHLPVEGYTSSRSRERLPKEGYTSSRSRDHLPAEGYAPSSRSRDYLPMEGYTASRSRDNLPVEDSKPARSRDHLPMEGYVSSRGRDFNLSDELNEGKDIDVGNPEAIEDVLQSVQHDWGYMASADCVPIQVALQLMDTSTIGKADREPDFLRMHQQIQKTLKSVVNEHHQGFNSSIGTYHKIQSSIQSSQGRVRSMRDSLEQAKGGVLSTKPELKELATSSQKYDDVLQLFNQIQEIQSLPEKLESRISDKRFLSAVDVLHDAFRLLRRSELENIGSLADIRAYFNNQQISLTDILVEELHDHLYLKSPYCSDRWKPPSLEGENSNGSIASNWTGTGPWEKPVYSFLTKLDASSPMAEDASRNPEADTFYYIQLLIESLNKMGHLDIAVDRIEQRLPVELFAVVDKTNAEVDSRYPTLTRGLGSQGSRIDLPTDTTKSRGHVLSEYLWGLYSKFEAIAEGHRVVHDVIIAIIEREGLPKNSSLTGGFKELWKLFQSEIRSILHDYLATDGDLPFRPGAAEDINSRHNLYPGQRDKNKKMFKFSEIEQNTEMKAEREELDELLRTSVPGLVSKSRQKTTTNDASKSRQGNSGTGHKILIEPGVFNISLLLPPSLFFIQRLKEIVPVDADIAMSTLTTFLDDFLVNVFLPQLDDTVTDLCTFNLNAADAFTEDPQWARVSSRPVFRGTVKFMSIIREFSKMLDSIPPDASFTQLLISQIVAYYDKCYGWYKSMVIKVSPRQDERWLKAAAAFAESGDVRDTVSELRTAAGDKRQELNDKEIDILLKSTNDVPLEPYDIVSDPKTVIALSLLHNSMQWLASHLAKLRQAPAVTLTPESSRPQSQSDDEPRSRRWTLITAMKARRDSISHPVYLPLNSVTANAFDTTLQSLRHLATTALFTLHIDIRCGVIHMLTKTMTGPVPRSVHDPVPTTPSPNVNITWWHILSNQPTSASPAVLQLNNDLIAFDTSICSYLGTEERLFITSGLARLIDRVFVSCTKYIGAMNANGASRLQLDVLVLQQNLKNIVVDPTGQEPREIVALPRSAKFLDWFLEGGEKALDYAKDESESYAKNNGAKSLTVGFDEPFTYDELKDLVELSFSEVLRGPRGADDREDFMAAKKASADAMLRLDQIMRDSK